MPDITSEITPSTGAQLDSAPPRPPKSRQSRSIMDLAGSTDESGLGMEAQNPLIQAMMAMGEVKKSLLLLSSQLPVLAPGIQQFIAGLEQTVPQLLSDLINGQAPGMGVPASPLSNQAPVAPSAQQMASP